MMDLGVRIDDVQSRHRVVAYPIAVFKRFSEHDGGRISASIAFYAFFSIFPLILVFVSVLDLLLSDNSDLRSQLIDSAIGQLPLVGQQIQAPSGASGGPITIAIGVATALWAGLGVINSLVGALATVWDIPPSSRPNFLMSRLRALAGLAPWPAW